MGLGLLIANLPPNFKGLSTAVPRELGITTDLYDMYGGDLLSRGVSLAPSCSCAGQP